MPEYDDTNRGVLFKNDRKESDNHPDYKGNINIDGVDCWLSAWIKTSKSGQKFMSLSVNPKDAQAAPQRPSKQAESRVATYGDLGGADDPIPF